MPSLRSLLILILFSASVIISTAIDFSIVLDYTLTHNGTSSSDQASYCSVIEDDYGYIAMDLGIIRKFNYKTQQIVGQTLKTNSNIIRGVGIINNFLYAYFSSDNKVKKFDKITLQYLSQIVLNDNCLQAYFDKTESKIYCSVHQNIKGIKIYSLSTGILMKTTDYNSRDDPTLVVDENSLFIGSFDQKNIIRIQNNGTIKQQDFKRILSSAGASGIQSMAISSIKQTYFLGDRYMKIWMGNAKNLGIQYNRSITSEFSSSSSIISIQVYDQSSNSVVISTAQQIYLFDKKRQIEYQSIAQNTPFVHLKVSPDKNYILRMGIKTQVFKISCPTGYYYNSTDMICLKCDSSCLTCDSLTAYCTSCLQGYYSSTFYCLTCQTNCLACNTTNCLICNTSYYLNGSVCTACDLSCNSSCSSATGYCTNCSIGFYQSTYYCLPCTINCNQCNADTCLNCSEGTFLNNTECSLCDTSCGVGLCNSTTGYCSNCTQRTYASTFYCLPCQQNCVSCNETDCFSCQHSYYVNGISCIPCDLSCNMSCNSITGRCTNCSSGFYTSTIFCLQCSTNCLQCNDNTGVCVQCQPGYFTKQGLCAECDISCNSSCNDITGFCTNCTQGYYQSTFYCLKCSENCKYCQNLTGNCLSCENGFYVSQDANCRVCGTSCNICLDITGDCIQCRENYYLKEKVSTFQCYSCGDNCLNCSNTTGRCYQCSQYYYLSQENQINCLRCDSSCKNCDNQTGYCLSCSLSNYFINETVCIPCAPQCLLCSSQKICNKCVQNYQLLQNNTCQLIQSICPQRYYLRQNKCIQCTYLCKVCDVYTGDCITCRSGFFLNGNVCRRCHQSCQECYEKMDQCITCHSDKYTLKDGKCQEETWLKVAGKAMSIPSFGQIKGARFGLLVCNSIWLYNYGNRTYYGPVHDIFENAQIIQEMKWSFLGISDEFLINENLLPLSDYSSYSNKKHLQQDRVDDVYIKNCFQFWCFTVPQIVITFFFAHTIIRMCSSFRIMKYFSAFSMIGYFFIMALQQNIQYLTYIAFNNFQMLFYFNFRDKLAAIFLILTFFVLIMYIFAAFFLFKYLYKKKNQYFLDNINNNLYSIIFFHLVIQCKYFLTGMIHSVLHNYYIVQISLLGTIELLVGLFCLYVLSRAQMYKVKVFAFVMILDYFIMGLFCFLLNTTYGESQEQNNIRNLTDSIFANLLYLMLINSIIKAVLSFIPQHEKIHKEVGKKQMPKTTNQIQNSKVESQIRLVNPNKTKKLYKLSNIQEKVILSECIDEQQVRMPSKSIFWQQKAKMKPKKFKVLPDNFHQIQNN